MGAGTNRINIHTIRKATKGFAYNPKIAELLINHNNGILTPCYTDDGEQAYYYYAMFVKDIEKTGDQILVLANQAAKAGIDVKKYNEEMALAI